MKRIAQHHWKEASKMARHDARLRRLEFDLLKPAWNTRTFNGKDFESDDDCVRSARFGVFQ